MTVPFIGGSANENNYISYVFDGVPASLSSVKITLAERIGESAFYGCSGLKQIILPENLKISANTPSLTADLPKSQFPRPWKR